MRADLPANLPVNPPGNLPARSNIESRDRLRLAVVSPFLDRQHGTERALSEVLERLARSYPCEIHLFAQQIAGLEVGSPNDRDPSPG